MNSRRPWIYAGILALLSLWYVSSFTEWIRPEPIKIVPQFRPLPKEILAKRAAREAARDLARNSPKPTRIKKDSSETPGLIGAAERKVVELVNKAATPPPTSDSRVGPGGPGGKDPKNISGETPLGGRRGFTGRGTDVQPFIFSLDGRYPLTSIKVVESSSTNGTAPVTWWLRSKKGSPSTDQILYGRVPATMEPVTGFTRIEKLYMGRTYTIFVEAGRRRGQATFSVPQDAEPVAPENTPPDEEFDPEKHMK